MKTTNKLKREYLSPVIEKVDLDSEVSLTMESTPDYNSDDEVNNINAPDYFNNDPYKNNVG